MDYSSRDIHKLTTLSLNVVRWDTNEQWCKALTDLVRDDIREQYVEYEPVEYMWSEFVRFIAKRFGYNNSDHAVIFAQFGLKHPEVREVLSVYIWETILEEIAESYIVVPENTDLYFIIVPNKSPKPLAPTLTLSILHPGRYDDLGCDVHPPWLSEPSSILDDEEELTPKPPRIVEIISDDEEESTPRPSRTVGPEVGDIDSPPQPSIHPSHDDNFEIPELRLPSPMSPIRRTEFEFEELENYSGDENAVHEAMEAVKITPIHEKEDDYYDYTDDYLERPNRAVFGRADAETNITVSEAPLKVSSDSNSSYSDGESEVTFPPTPVSASTPERVSSLTAGRKSPGVRVTTRAGRAGKQPSASITSRKTPAIPTAKSNKPSIRGASSAARGRPATRGAAPNLAPRGSAILSRSTPSQNAGPITDRPPSRASFHRETGLSRSNAIRRPTGISPIRTDNSKPSAVSPSSLASPSINDIPPESYLEIVDMLGAEYNVNNAEDDDYGAVDLGVVDTYVGSYGTGDNLADWQACLDFFNINLTEYQKREAIANKSSGAGGARKRVPMKKLPGMSVGLFDYQLMGVFNLLKFVLNDVSGGLLCDEQGLGKTQEMYGLIAFAHNLRRCRAEVKAAWKGGKNKGGSGTPAKSKGVPGQHNPPNDSLARSCPFDERYGFRCYCYHELTRELADRLPEGPNIMVAPARNCGPMVRDAKTKLDTKVFKIRGCYEGVDKNDRLTGENVNALHATITGKKGGAEPVYQYQAGTGQSDYIIVVSPEYISRLNTQFGVAVLLAYTAETAKKSALLPGMILMDEFHEYAISKDGEDSRTVAWLQHLKRCCLDSQQPTPLAYFVSGTPFGETPVDIRPAISLLEKDVWCDESHPLTGASLAAFDDLTRTFDTLTGLQASGEVIPRADVVDYRRRLDRVLQHTMVRRLGTDQFQGRNLTEMGPLKVNIVDHLLPFAVTSDLQSLALRTRDLAIEAATTQGIPLSRLLRSKTGEALLLKLRLASTFPGIAAASATDFTFTPSELRTHLSAAKGDVTKTPYFPHIPSWSAHSPKLESISQTILTMLADKTPIPGRPSPQKKYCIFCPVEAEAVLLYGYLLLKRATAKYKSLKPILLHSSLRQPQRQKVLDQFLTEGNAPPNVLVAPLSLAGTGLNLQRAKYSTVTSPAWTKRENQQAYYRIHRVGQVQETKLSLLVGRWNPAERIILAGYEGRTLMEGEEEGEKVWEVDNGFCGGGQEGGDGLIERHQNPTGER
ncbi:hypothetical protein C8A03DRAFT_45007 [Achaetomium macrosporum]|uniref:Helicase C-terminal domain-containing protein n=1 Tax=Achaetomium macrosporum TaxID=79813 RepID=A0AAN7HEC8_9PEZI|nr:hypothetical protein C8A03DRAFT_45007 [Achaetomium macrosporum]